MKKKWKKNKKKEEEFNGNFDLDFGTGNEKSLWQISESLKQKAKGKVRFFFHNICLIKLLANIR